MRAGNLVQYFCYLCAILFLIAGLVRRSSLMLSAEGQFTSLLLIFTVTLLFVCVGTLSYLATRIAR